MSIYHNIIRFNKETNYDYELIVANFEPDSGEVDTYLSLEPIFTDSYDGTDTNDYGAKYTTKATPRITFVEPDGGDIPSWKVRRILRWLTGQRNVSWMSLLDDDGNEVCSYLGRFTSVNQQKLDARVIGLVCQFTATSPWALSPVQEVSMTIGNGTSFAVENDSDDLYTSIYPDVTFENKKSGASLVLKNNTADSETRFSNLSYGEKVTIGSNLMAYSSTNRLFKNDFNFEFPQLFPGVNDFEANGNGVLTIKFRYPMKVGDGLYDIRDGVEVWVEGGILKIRGDVTQIPPTGINIKITDGVMTVRGDLSFVNIPRPTIVENGNLTIENSGKECPFDALDAKVIDGELIINYDLPGVSSNQVKETW